MNNNLTPASTVLVLRDNNNLMEVLMVKRSKKPPFENLYVFPGGKIDENDLLDDLESYTDGLDDKSASDLLGLKKDGLSFWIASIRECFEEVGIFLATRRSGEKLLLDDSFILILSAFVFVLPITQYHHHNVLTGLQLC